MKNPYKYKAFISYRHIDPDKQIADQLQKKLESYKPPKSLGKKGLGRMRIFRDETELTTSSNLSTDIKTALEQSEFLIVVCSEATKDSRWCMEEIEHFKQLHNGSNANIITMVADGNPEDAFPPSLCHELVPVVDADGNTTYETRTIEPLAANVAGNSLKDSFKKLKTEFLRIAAPLLGCDYDSLYNREQKKKTKKLVAIGSTILAFLLLFSLYNGAMLLKINNQNKELSAAYVDLQAKTEEAKENLEEAKKQQKIAEENLEEAKKQQQIAEENLAEAERQTKIAEENMLMAINNEAKANEANRNLKQKNTEILANQAQLYLDGGDYHSALTTALEAIPDKSDGIEHDGTAEYVLATATNSYTVSDVTTNRRINLSAYVKDLQFNADGSRLLAQDKNGAVYIIDTVKNTILKTHTPLSLFGSTNNYLSDVCLSGNTAYVLDSDELISIDMQDGSINWHFDTEEPVSLMDNIITNENADSVFLCGSFSSTSVFVKKDGTLIKKSDQNTDSALNNLSLNFDKVCMDQSGTVYGTIQKSRKLFVATPDNIRFYDLNIDENDEVLCISENEDSVFVNIRTIPEDSFTYKTGRLICLNKKNLSVTWSTDYEAPDYLSDYDFNGIYDFPHVMNEQKIEGILIVSGKNFLAFDKKSGAQYHSYANDKYVLFCAKNPNTNTILRVMTEDVLYPQVLLYQDGGTETLLAINSIKNQTNAYYAATSPLNNKTAYAAADSSEIIISGTLSAGANFNLLPNYPIERDNPYKTYVDEDNSIFAYYDYEYQNSIKNNYITVYDFKNKRCLGSFKTDIDVEQIVLANNKILVFDYTGNAKVYDYNGTVLEELNLPEKIKASAGFDDSTYISMYDSYIHKTKNGILLGIKSGLYRIDLSGETIQVKWIYASSNLVENHCVTGDFASFTIDSFFVDNSTKIAFFKEGDSELNYVSQNGSPCLFKMDSIQTVTNTDVGHKIAFVSKEGYIGLYGYGDETFSKITLPKAEITSNLLRFTPDGSHLIIVCDNGKVYKINVKSGTIEGEFDADFAVSTLTELMFLDERTFGISHSDTLTAIDINSMKKTAEVKNFEFYMKNDHKFICTFYVDEQLRLGYFNHLSIDELMDAANRFLGND